MSPTRHQLVPTVLLATLAVACGGERKPGLAPTVQLIELLGQVEVVGPEAALGEHPPAVRPSRLVRPRDRDYLGRVALEAETGEPEERLAIVVPSGTRLRFPIEERGRARLRLGWGPLHAEAPAAGAESPPVHATARVVDGDGPGAVIAAELSAVTWSDAELECDLRPGTVVELEAGGPAGTWVAFSSPVLVGAKPPGWDVLLISLDTLRADHLGSYGYQRPTSPHLDAFAIGAFRFARAYASGPWTLPSHLSLFNGLYPRSYGDFRSPPIAVVLSRAGYDTQALTGGGIMDYRMSTFAQGFGRYRYHDWIRDLDAVESALKTSRDRRRFLFLHTYEPHDPYIDTRFAAALPSGRLDGYFDKGLYPHIRRDISEDERHYIKALYDGDIAFTDEQLGELFARLEVSGVLERTIVAITSDHGEQFWEHGSWRHGQNLYDEQIHVPLIVRLPEGLRRELGLPRGGIIDDQVRLIDVYPTLLELLGVPLEKPVQGRSLVPLMRGEERNEVEALAEYLNVDDVQSKALRFRGFKFLRTLSGDPESRRQALELYDLRRDPAELVNLIEERPEIADELRALLDQLVRGEWTAEGEALEEEDLDSDLRRDLEALGYIGDG